MAQVIKGKRLVTTLLLTWACSASAQIVETVIDIPTRAGVTQRLLVQRPPEASASVVLFPGGHGGLQISSDGKMRWGRGNFLVRSRHLFAAKGIVVALLDAPSDRLNPPYLSGFRQTNEHVADLKAVIAWLRSQTHKPVWLIGTSRGTQSVAYVGTELTGQDGPDGLVLTSSILTDRKSLPVPSMALEKIKVPVLVVHHMQDGCSHCSYSETPLLMSKLINAPRTELLPMRGGQSQGDPCEAFAYHGFNGIEADVVDHITAWILNK
ncbi:MAG TPA: alpha/beta hydrolase [Aquabacterium sp.]|nr:alpha/beta hydrolase [Aquabacterium sp.]